MTRDHDILPKLSVTLRRIGAAALIVLTVAVAPASAGQNQASDPRLSQNPLLRQIQRERPETVPGFLRELDALKMSPSAARPRSTSLAPTTRELSQIQANPAFQQGFKARPDAMLDLLRRMNGTLTDPGRPQR